MFQKQRRLFIISASTAAGLTLGLLMYHGQFRRVKVFEHNIGPFNFIYFNKVGKYSDAAVEWKRVVDEMKESFDKSRAVGLYYDNPMILSDFDQARVSMGFVVPDTEKDKIQEFLEKHPDYKQATLPEVKSAAATFPYKSFLSFKVIEDKIYPKIYQQFMKKNTEPSCLMESYIFDEKIKRIECDAPYGDGSEKYKLM